MPDRHWDKLSSELLNYTWTNKQSRMKAFSEIDAGITDMDEKIRLYKEKLAILQN